MAASCYRFYLQRDRQTFAAEVLECDSDSDAIVKAKELLALSKTFHLMEFGRARARSAQWRRVLPERRRSVVIDSPSC